MQSRSKFREGERFDRTSTSSVESLTTTLSKVEGSHDEPLNCIAYSFTYASSHTSSST